MANPDHVAKLQKGVSAWNEWRAENPCEIPNLSMAEIHLIKLETTLLNEGLANSKFNAVSNWELLRKKKKLAEVGLPWRYLDGVNLEGVNFAGTYLEEVILQEVNLQNANLKQAMLDRAILQGACLTKANLLEARLVEANLEGAWLDTADLSKATLEMANLQGAILNWASLTGADLLGVNLEGASLNGADLQGANLRGAILKGADLTGADVCGADLTDANLENAKVTGIKFSRKSVQEYSLKIREKQEEPGKWIVLDLIPKYQGIRVATCYGSQDFKSFAQDQDYLEEFWEKGHYHLFLIWFTIADCGRSIWRWIFWSVLFAMFFTGLIYCMGTDHFVYAHLKPEFLSAMYYSVVTFTTLGFGDVVPKTPFAAIIIMMEVIVGYVMLGGLISILANKLARRA